MSQDAIYKATYRTVIRPRNATGPLQLDIKGVDSVAIQISLHRYTINFMPSFLQCIPHTYPNLIMRRPRLVESSSERLINRKTVDSAESIRRISRAKDLLRITAPFGVIDTVNPVLDFHDQTVVFADGAGAAAVEEALGVFDREGAWWC